MTVFSILKLVFIGAPAMVLWLIFIIISVTSEKIADFFLKFFPKV